ncbi:hypothetical protein RIR_jg42063.t1 [Rhizophagus irregularis DAOM 181602=DAOM 197198]|nr:hypothetical protein RIR_jg42063.t1 [Rhizophagus irregularis DAOM 181602=DAOM 197198]
MEKPSFIRPFGWASEVWKNQVSFGHSGGLPCSKEWENSKDLIEWASEEWKTKKLRFVSKIGWAFEERKPKDSFGWLLKPRFVRPFGFRWASEERKRTKICKYYES